MIHRIVKLLRFKMLINIFIIITFGASGPEPFVIGVSVAGAAHIFTLRFITMQSKMKLVRKPKTALYCGIQMK